MFIGVEIYEKKEKFVSCVSTLNLYSNRFFPQFKTGNDSLLILKESILESIFMFEKFNGTKLKKLYVFIKGRPVNLKDIFDEND